MVINHLQVLGMILQVEKIIWVWDHATSLIPWGQGPLTKQLLAVEDTFPISLNSPARFTRSAFPKASFRDCLGRIDCVDDFLDDTNL